MTRYGYLGPEGTFTEAALRQVARPDEAEYLPQSDVSSAIAAVRSGEADFAVVAIESTVEGGVTATLDSLATGEPLVLLGEVLVPVQFTLAAAPGVRLADVGGLTEVKKRLEASFLAPLRNPELRALYGKSLRGGLLLYGPPGCGKTFLAKAVAGELGQQGGERGHGAGGDADAERAGGPVEEPGQFLTGPAVAGSQVEHAQRARPADRRRQSRVGLAERGDAEYAGFVRGRAGILRNGRHGTPGSLRGVAVKRRAAGSEFRNLV